MSLSKNPASLCRVETLDPTAHAAPLFAALHGPGNAALWRHLREGPAESVAALVEHLTEWTALPHVRAYVFRTPAGEVAGMGARLWREISDHSTLQPGPYEELAAIVFHACYHGTGLPRQGVALLIEMSLSNRTLNGCLWRCSIDNVASDRFARKLGFRRYASGPDGTAKGVPRHSYFYVLKRDTA